MKKALENFSRFEITNPKFIFGGNADDDNHKRGKKKIKGNQAGDGN